MKAFYLRKLRLSEGRRKFIFGLPSVSRFDEVNLAFKEKEFTYNLKGQSPKHTRRGFCGFCLKKKFLFSLDETEKIVKVNVKVEKLVPKGSVLYPHVR